MRVDSSCPIAISSLDEPVCGEKEEEECLCDNNPKYAMCAQHLDESLTIMSSTALRGALFVMDKTVT